ncbi:hypothetical protein OO013_06285 [Mangrovivirga sp. M17]|uniref:Uncharacterized protein n=1 Tax=Mangrovivirga halotolerans TaxID=2993936 RepID=A0ABT3RNS7_9BACT|nr:hypothetical protein [Mangrovivirga halotolerans]MCX2743465.1 hypothetical protein [Mangrovivirga halotolerans]
MRPAITIETFIGKLDTIQFQANQVLKSKPLPAAINAYSRYSKNLKESILEHVKDEEIIEITNEIPEFTYEPSEIKAWHYIVFPIAIAKNLKNKNRLRQCLDMITDGRNKYSKIEFLIRGEY